MVRVISNGIMDLGDTLQSGGRMFGSYRAFVISSFLISVFYFETWASLTSDSNEVIFFI